MDRLAILIAGALLAVPIASSLGPQAVGAVPGVPDDMARPDPPVLGLDAAVPSDAREVGTYYSRFSGERHAVYKDDAFNVWTVDSDGTVYRSYDALLAAQADKREAAGEDLDLYKLHHVLLDEYRAYVADPLAQDRTLRVIVLFKEQPLVPVAEAVWAARDDAIEAAAASLRSAETTSERASAGLQLETLLDDGRRAISAQVAALNANLQGPVLHELRAGGMEVLDGARIVNDAVLALPLSRLPELVAHPSVWKVGEDLAVSGELEYSIADIQANWWWQGGATGTPWDIAIVDTGADCTHPTVGTSRCISRTFHDNLRSDPGWVTQCYRDDHTTTDDLHGHGTHVTGIAAGGYSSKKGVAWEAHKVLNVKALARKVNDPGGPCGSGTSTGFFSDMRIGIDWAINHAADTAEVINFSVGSCSLSDGDHPFERFLDAVVLAERVAIAKSGGNCGPGSGSTGVPAGAYNVITVGNVDDQNTVAECDNTLSASSSRGPTLDGRTKPDITAPGTRINSARHTWEGSTSDWIEFSGTSMAAPHIAGAMLLMLDEGTMGLARDYKGDLMLTAIKLCNNPGPQPNNDWGWGHTCLACAWTHRGDYIRGAVREGDDDWFRVEPLHAGDEFTVIWERYSVYNGDDSPVNFESEHSDLDLQIWNEAGNTLLQGDDGLGHPDYPRIFSQNAASQALVKVHGTNVLPNNALETFTISATWDLSSSAPSADNHDPTHFVPVDGPEIEVDLGGPSTASKDQTFTVTATAENPGDAITHDATVTLTTVPSSCTRTSGSITQNVGDLQPGQAGNAAWSVRCSSSGAKSFEACAASTSYGVGLSDCDTHVVSIDGPPTPPTVGCSPGSIQEGESTTCTATSTDPDGNEIHYVFTWGDGTSNTRRPSSGTVPSGTAQSATHTFSSQGTYTVSVTATDTTGATSAAGTAIVSVGAGNVPPTMTSLSCTPNPSTAGASVDCSFSASDDGTAVHYVVDWGDGSPDARVPSSGTVLPGTTRVASHTFTASGSFTVSVTATDNEGATSPPRTTTQTVSQPDTAPVMQDLYCTPNPSNEAESATCWFYATDDSGGVHYTVDWGDGTPTTRVPPSGTTSPGQYVSSTHAWTPAGSYTVSVTATDPGGRASAPRSATQTVVDGGGGDQAPVMQDLYCTPEPSDPDQTVTCWMYATDDSAGVYYEVDLGDGSPVRRVPASGTTAPGDYVSASYAWSAAGSYLVSARATDDGGAASGQRSVTHTVAGGSDNQAPVMQDLYCTPNPVEAGQSTTCWFYATDGSTGLAYTIDWGDGVSSRVPASGFTAPGQYVSATHAWSSEATYTVGVIATDDEGAAGTLRTVVQTVTQGGGGNQPPTVDLLACQPSPARSGERAVCSMRASDDSSGVFFTVDWGDGSPVTRVPTSGTIAPGTTVSVGHVWGTEGVFRVTAKATDTDETPQSSLPVVLHLTVQPGERCIIFETGSMLVGLFGREMLGVSAVDVNGIPAICGGEPFSLTGTFGSDFNVCWYEATRQLACYQGFGAELGIIPKGSERARVIYFSGAAGSYTLQSG